MEINKKLTPYNFTAMKNKENKYIVVHYVGEISTARANANYFYNTNTSKIGKPASAHYFVDENEIWQVVEDKNKAWHVKSERQGTGGGKLLKICTNSNSIGIEMCCKKRGSEWYFEEKTLLNAAELIAELMKKHNIPIERVIRHYDVTGKICPEPLINEEKWTEFKNLITGGEEMTLEEKRKFNAALNEIERLTKENDILKQAIGWNSTNPGEPALYMYNDENITKYITADGNEVLGRLIASGKLAVDKNGAFAPMCKAALRLLIIEHRE